MSVNVQLPPNLPSDSDKAHRAALHLLTLEAEVRQQPDAAKVLFHLINNVQQMVPYDQGMVFSRVHPRTPLHLSQVSGLPVADRHTPLARGLQGLLREQERGGRLGALLALELPVGKGATSESEALAEFPLRHAVWLPLQATGTRLQRGVLLLRTTPFTPREQVMLQRLADTYSHALRAFGKQRSLLDRLPWSRRSLVIAVALVVGAGLIPVRLSVMAPVEVIAEQPYILTAPINGVIRHILVAPNSLVQANQPLVQFEDIQPRNEMVVAQQQLAVAEAKDTRTSAAAFNDAQASHDTAIARAEHDLARVSYNYALEVLQRTQMKTPISGMAVYSDRRDWEGRAVQVGEEILQVADPARIAYRVDLSTGNAIELAVGNPVSIYLESSPMGGLKAQLRSVSYSPHTTPAGVTSYTVIADPQSGETPRIGARGTARVYGDYAPLAIQLLRRPLAAARQFLGV
ncbi:HlyD family efflux transporter periplasmic adaptor subunit [Pseudomonas sp. dw_358]|uniref:HlyD family efflux transporter periplasmic adaptor subunit n=1 Tax=Pseudomonas sp. dw_358 TaxID=2720083 RepID=UPI001BD20733|nr:HlyD family efflux transporter periplasmic adaptor subunit [Pseudomonas sp. dw_358]